MNLFRSLIVLSSALAFAASPSAAQDSGTGTSTLTSPPPASSSSSNGSSSSTTTSSFGNLTTTNSLGSTIVTSIPITIPLNTTPTSTSSAPFPSLTGYPTCVVNCLTYAVAQSNCTSITAVNCYCPSSIFPNALYSCVVGNCSSNVPSSENLAQQFCALDNVTVSFSITAAPSTASSSVSSPASSTSHNTTPFNAASVVSWTPDTRGWVTMMVAVCSALFGAALL